VDSETISQTATAVHLTPFPPKKRRSYFDDGRTQKPHEPFWTLYPDGTLATFAEVVAAAEAAAHQAHPRSRKLIKATRRYQIDTGGTIPPLTPAELRILTTVADRGLDLGAETIRPLVKAFLKAMATTGDPK
jgi:hypothetical protein